MTVFIVRLTCGGGPSIHKATTDNGISPMSLHLSYSCISPYGPAILVTHGRVEMWRGGCRLNISVAASFDWRCLSGSTMARFHIPLIEPDKQISCIRLSDKTSRLCFRVQRHLQFLNTLRS